MNGLILFGMPALMWCVYWAYVLKTGRALDKRQAARKRAALEGEHD